MTREIAIQNNQSTSMQQYVFANAQAFEDAQRMATALSKSTLVPKDYQNNMPNCLIALEIAHRVAASPLMIMQNLYIVHGRPSWSSQFIISAINTSGKFKPLRYAFNNGEKYEEIEYELFETEWVGGKKSTNIIKKKAKILNNRCYAWTEDLSGQILKGPEVSITMAFQEGWHDKPGSKWKTMPELMLTYRAAAFFGRVYAPEILMGMKTIEESEDIIDVTPSPVVQKTSTADKIKERLSKKKPQNSASSSPLDAEDGLAAILDTPLAQSSGEPPVVKEVEENTASEVGSSLPRLSFNNEIIVFLQDVDSQQLVDKIAEISPTDRKDFFIKNKKEIISVVDYMRSEKEVALINKLVGMQTEAMGG